MADGVEVPIRLDISKVPAQLDALTEALHDIAFHVGLNADRLRVSLQQIEEGS